MPLDPVQRLLERLERAEARIKALETAPFQQNLTIDRGQTKVLSPEGLLVGEPGNTNGSQTVYGTLTIVGTLNGDGTMSWTGPWEISGNGEITGDVTATGTWTQNGPWNLNGDGEITGDVTQTGDTDQQGNVTIATGGKITVAGSDPIVIAQEGGQAKIKVGTTGEIAGSDAGIQMMVTGDLNRRVVVTPDAIRLIGVTNAASDAVPDFWLGIQLDGTLRRYSPGSGGPMGGDFDWPFSLSLVTSEYGVRVHPVTGVTTMHNGIDFGAPGGANIPAASRGTVVAAGSDSGRGNYVVLSHPNDVETHYFHMISTPSVSVGQVVAKGATLGQVGSTGLSDGNHLHFEVHVDGSPINPRDFAALD